MKRTTWFDEEVEFELWNLDDVIEESEAQADFWADGDYRESVLEYLKRYKELLNNVSS